MFISHLYVFFGEMSVLVFCPFFDQIVFLILSCMSFLYILEVKFFFSFYFIGNLFSLFLLFFKLVGG